MSMWTAIVLIVIAAMAGEAWRHHVRARGSGINRDALDELNRKIEALDKELRERVETLEQRMGPGQPVTEEQASQISQAVKAVAMPLSKSSGSNQYGAVYGELYRKFGVTSYKLLPVERFNEAMEFLTEWHQDLVGDEPF